MAQEWFKSYHTQQLWDWIVESKKNTKITSVLDAIDAFSREKYRMIHIGDTAKDMIQKYTNTETKQILELGAYVGYSSLFMAKNAPNAQIASLEISRPLAQFCQKITSFLDLQNRISYIREDAKKTIPTLKNTFDFVLFDHDKRHYVRDLMLLFEYEKIKTGTKILFDNLDHEQLTDFPKFLQANKAIKILEINPKTSVLEVL